jgi:rsbT co-antagonist protein RsbR
VNADRFAIVSDTLRKSEQEILANWQVHLRRAGVGQEGRVAESELQAQCRSLLGAFLEALSSGTEDTATSAYAQVRDILNALSRSRALQGYSPIETATLVFSLKQPLFDQASRAFESDPKLVAEAIWSLTRILDTLGLQSMETFQRTREEVIIRQQQEIAELSTPVVQLWKGVLALPLIGTLDSARTQVVMENLLESIVSTEAEIAIIDITGVPTVDTLVAQYLLKTVAAARLMGADCIISGIRPQIAQTMVHLGVELNVVSKATLADAFGLALRRTGRTIVQASKVADRSTVRG